VVGRRKMTVKPERTKTVRTPGGGKTRVKNDGDKVDVRITPPKR
jgi:hypothetical protein